MKTKKKRSSLKFSPGFGLKLGEDEIKKKVFTQILSLLCAQTFCPSYKGGPCRNFAYNSMIIIGYYSSDPKGGMINDCSNIP